MTRTLVRATAPVTLIGGGPVDPAQLRRALAIAPDAVAADGGGDVPLPGGQTFRAVIGDMDSLRDPGALRVRNVPIFPVEEQESTDLEKCLAAIEAPLVVGLGFLGGRLDHQLAAMNALARFAHQRVILVGGEDVCFLSPPEFSLPLAAETRVSLFPLAPVRGTRSHGLRWPIEGLAFDPIGQIGTSNAATGGPMEIGFDAPRMLVILPAEELEPAAERLRGAEAVSWPRSRRS